MPWCNRAKCAKNLFLNGTDIETFSPTPATALAGLQLRRVGAVRAIGYAPGFAGDQAK